MLVDSHCHLDYPDFAAEGLAEIVSRARSAGIGHFLTICTEISKFPQV
ncbi:MAG: TatD family hydrolase, partial [Alphaproteobacteria bacterium]